jgi:uncharacterized protein YqgC (DUF456 family)
MTTHLLAVLLLIFTCVIGLILVPLGLPGLWVMVAGVIGYGALTDFHTVGLITIVLVIAIAFFGEIVDNWIGYRYTRRYGGSRRAAWGALIGGLVGAVVGIPIPVIGSVIGSFVGSFVGAAAFELTRTPDAGNAARVGWGALIGRAIATGAKTGLALLIGVIGAVAALRG